MTAPNGTYAVFWTASSDTNVTAAMCPDFSGTVSDSGFAATRLPP